MAEGVRQIEVADGDAEIRLDRWFRRHYPGLSHGRLEKLLRTGQVRVGGGRAKAGTRLAAGDVVRVPPLETTAQTPRRAARPAAVRDREADALRALVLYYDDEVIALNKPPGIAVQGGTRTPRHLDAMLDALCYGSNERPRLVHRLDKDTSGVLLLGRTAAAAAWLAAGFRQRETRKIYWALVAGVPRPHAGTIDLRLAKHASAGGERIAVADEEGKRAITHYAVIEAAGRRAAWLALMPQTGRTHQLRAHCAALGAPILGDGKYGGKAAFPEGLEIARRLHLHAREIAVERPGGGLLRVRAPLPDHMIATWRFLGFNPEHIDDPFEDM